MGRNSDIAKLISNLANSVIHQILEKAIDRVEIKEYYRNEIINSWKIANKYRQKINPTERNLLEVDVMEIKKKVVNRVKAELKTRIDKGYKNIDLERVEEFVDKALREMKVL